MLQNIALLLVSFAVSLLSIVGVLIVTHRFGIFDPTEDRKIHTGNIPRLGGIGIVLGFIAGLLLFYFFSRHGYKLNGNVLTLVTGSLLIFVMGVWDDIKPLKARKKLFVQCLAALIVLFGNFAFTRITFKPLNFAWDLGVLRYPLTFFWILGVTNALNLIDGLDGLAGSISFMASLSYALFFYKYGNEAAMIVCLILAVSISGFLFFNLPLPRAKIFMGDGGSQFLGFALAILPLMNDAKGFATIALPYAFAVLLIPIYDTIAAIWRRLREKRRLGSPDRFHLHHKLILMGFSVRQALAIILVFQLIIGILVGCSVWLRGLFASILLFTVFLLGILFFTVIHIRKEQILAETAEENWKQK